MFKKEKENKNRDPLLIACLDSHFRTTLFSGLVCFQLKININILITSTTQKIQTATRATSQLSTVNSPLYKSWEDLKDGLKSGGAGSALTSQAWRLFWRLDGDFPAAISVMETDRAANELAPFFEASGGTWHEIAQLPLTQPKVSSIDATLYDFRQWATPPGYRSREVFFTDT